jgi:hypothetical protein
MVRRGSTASLVFTGLALSVGTGAGLYQQVFEMPLWFAEPPASFARIAAGGADARAFWIPVQAAAVLGLVASLLLNWGSRRRRALLAAAVAGLIAGALATGVYYLPEVLAFAAMPPDGPPSPELTARGHQWLALNWVRQGLAVAIQGLVLVALGTPAVRRAPAP